MIKLNIGELKLEVNFLCIHCRAACSEEDMVFVMSGHCHDCFDSCECDAMKSLMTEWEAEERERCVIFRYISEGVLLGSNDN